MAIDANRVIQIIGVIVVALQGYTASQIPGIENSQREGTREIIDNQEKTSRELLIEINQHQSETLDKILTNQGTITGRVVTDLDDIDKAIKDYKEKHP